MGTLHRAMWVSSGAGTSRRQRASGVYHWFLPTMLADLSYTLDADVVADVARAERDLANASLACTPSTEGIARLLLRSEAVASSRIEGLVIGSNMLLRAELQENDPANVRYDSKAAAVLGNIHAMEQAVRIAAEAQEITPQVLRDVHRALCAGTDLEEWGGVIRTSQNWVGGGSSNPLSAEYVPPAPEEVPALLEDLCAYANRTDTSAVAQAALCHAQFETIHPFADGNGRTGRALIQICLIRRGVAPNSIPPISLALATQREDYYASLNAYQHATDSLAENAAVNDWVSCFCAATSSACKDVEDIARDMEAMCEAWRCRMGGVRKGSAVEAMLPAMQAMPYFSVETMTGMTGRSKQAIGVAVRRLLDAGIIRQTNRGKRSRVFEVPEVLAEFNMVERRLASPSRDTSLEGPARPVPARASKSPYA